MEHTDDLSGGDADPVIDLRRAAFLWRGDCGDACTLRYGERGIVAAAIDQQHLVRLGLHRIDRGERRGQRPFFVPGRDQDGDTDHAANPGQRARSSGRSQSESMSSNTGVMPRRSSRASVSGSTCSVLHGMSVSSSGSDWRIPIR